MTISLMTVNGVAYHVAQHGLPTLPRLLLLHGFTGSSDNWRPHIAAFTDSFHVLTIDILGHGRSASPADPKRYSMAQVAADIVGLLDGWSLDQTALLGYSMGGRLALYLACHNPARFSQLILESSSPGLATEAERTARRQRDDTLAAWIEANGIEAFVRRWESLPLWASQQQLGEDVRLRLHQQRLQNNPVGLANSLRGMGTGAQPSLWQKLPTLAMPTLLIAGELDSKFVAINQQMVSQLNNGRLHIIPQAGHMTHLERPFVFQHVVRQFLGH